MSLTNAMSMEDVKLCLGEHMGSSLTNRWNVDDMVGGHKPRLRYKNKTNKSFARGVLFSVLLSNNTFCLHLILVRV